jgi:hypothetical protein
VAELNVEAERTRGRLEMQARQIGVIDERWRRARPRRKRSNRAISGRDGGVGIAYRRRGANSKPRADRCGRGWTRRLASAMRCRTNLRGRERTIEQSRQLVLRLLGEASTLRNQLAQIDEYLAAMERDSARARKEEESASTDLVRLEQVKTPNYRNGWPRGRSSWNRWCDRRRRVEEE